MSSRSPTIYLEVTQAFTVCSRGYQNNQCQNGRRRKAILLTSSCIRPTANSSAESVVCPYMASAQLPPSTAPLLPPHSLHWTALENSERSLCQRQVWKSIYTYKALLHLLHSNSMHIWLILLLFHCNIYLIDKVLVLRISSIILCIACVLHLSSWF